MPATCMPSVSRAWARNMEPNFPAPMRPTVTGFPAALRASSNRWRFMAKTSWVFLGLCSMSE